MSETSRLPLICSRRVALGSMLAFMAQSQWAYGISSKLIAKQEREFDIFIDGSARGESRLIISEFEDGHASVAVSGKISLNLILFTFQYELSETEVWHGENFLRAETEVNNNGTKSKVALTSNKDKSQVSKDGKVATGPRFVWSNNYWRAPSDEILTKKIHVLESETGDAKLCTLERAGNWTLPVNGEKISLRKYQLKGELQAEVAFDEQGRLAYQKTKKIGRLAELKLRRVRSLDTSIAQR
ncbi:MAG: DUF6134 family protein [Planctomycetaceae bacterium]